MTVQEERRLDRRRLPDLCFPPPDPFAVDLLGSELQLEALAHDAGKEAAHRVLLPAGCLHHRVNRRTCWQLEHRDNMGLFGARLAIWPLRLASGRLRWLGH